ncbi:DNA ligase D [Aurantimonas sp. VKM B-3413]|uniref:DNA ligase D n=1 Tax=Aurantimonas sp. VKM B-3413 TaxID=2779401 RepID=UPI001E618121|nr:DNA ligase D [Aurantimonas sp. VKM B-3413]MCB8836564.1 DNA ligase D [Aurantimonas sp. VKM B-3413]
MTGKSANQTKARAGGETLLKTYREKRDFSRTREPAGGGEATPFGEGLYFCVQKHDATRLHYDFRIEWDGVLKSWAVTKGPSLDPADKRLAVRTEDHPMEYGDFEGTIPQKEYGGGTVMLWDRGTWEPREDPVAGFKKGSLKMDLHGERMHGHWALVRMKPRGKEKRENWLLIKEKDEEAHPGEGEDILKADRSVKTGRAMAEIAVAKDDVWDDTRAPGETETAAPQTKPKAEPKRSRAGKEPAGTKAKTPSSAAKTAKRDAGGKALPLPRFHPPQLATLVDAAPEGREWLHEMKYDGYRVVIAAGGGDVRCYTRNGLDWTEKFGPISEAAKGLPCRSALIDGEIVAFDDNGKTDFSTLQQHLSEGGPLTCFCFDLMALDGEDLTSQPLTERKAALKALLGEAKSETLLYSEHVTSNGPAVFSQICASGHEGIVSKRADVPYRSGRSKSWLKVKCSRRQEFVIGGFRPSDKRGRPFSSILIGVMEGGDLVYRGRVGSGFDEARMDELAARFDGLARKTSPFASIPPDVRRQARFVTPSLVAEVEFAELTADGHVRHGVFKGLREDKGANEVTDETPQPKDGKTADARGPAKAQPGGGSRGRSAKGGKGGDPVEIAGIRITHPDRIVFEGQGVTKGDLARYYEEVAERMLVHAGDRPVSLVRCPDGPAKHCFFQKHDSGGFPDAVKTVTIAEKEGGTAEYLTMPSAAALVGAVQMSTLEFHIWGARNDRLERPDRLVFDLDPDEGLAFSDVKAAATDLRDALAHLGLETFPMVTGGKGVHIVAPLERRQGWDDLKGFARAFAQHLAAEEPGRFVATMSKAKRKGKIFVDWLRNERGSTAIAPYSTRSRAGAPVATPVTWDELSSLSAANGFDIDAVLKRLDEADPWAGYGDVRQSLTKKMLAAIGA